jgi:hypothetical protein
MPFTSWNGPKARAKNKLKILQMLTHSGVVRPAAVELRYGVPAMKGPSSASFEDRIPYGFYLSAKGWLRKKP